MKLLSQSAELKKAWQDKVKQKVSARQQKVRDQFSNNPFADFMQLGSSLQQARNNMVGNLGELLISMLLDSLPNDWLMFKNALIPTNNSNLTEIDLLVIGTKGIFLIEVKTWKGSFSAYQDKWKMRRGNQWISLSHSPSNQSQYHLNVFNSWLKKNQINIAFDLVYAPVVFSIARWLGITDCSVPIFKNQMELLEYIKQCPERLSTQQIKMVSHAIANCSFQPTDKPAQNKGIKPKPILRKSKRKSI